ncbi:PPK2 family polyphosphate kinase [Jeotgalibacillus haloalkalitolerans]|uniref:PPK2 family polyphosphate kinase n=1 Tax=Jeotgalibacillus haloalkalitolerans TaxID=3104292 RepID=A0ABU5KN74_9BACL|nr:PPK2 family polyphosphate kinase [Jeotgalibacillus sp. HH7-29]MDZ5712707.1 PPK2 family polyphosphate kinase [Jeotgalibacillus sp. HH7-29]
MDFKKYLVEGNKKVQLQDYATKEDHGFTEDELRDEILPESIDKLKELHWRLHAAEKRGIVVVLQAMDAAGKDEAISYIFSNLTAQGLKTASFQKPSETELKHDYLWRIREGLPARGQVGILNRSHYEEVIAPKVHKDQLKDEMYPEDMEKDEVWPMRYRQIKDFEQHLDENGFEVIKFFFNMSKEEQRERLLERLKNPEKNWEFSFNDIKERRHWDTYQEAFEDMLEHTSTDFAPWYVLPADDELYSRYVITEVMVDCLNKIDPQFPEISDEDQEKLDEAIEELENEEN